MRSAARRPVAVAAAVVVAVIVTAVVGVALSASRGGATPAPASAVTVSRQPVTENYVAMGSSFAAGPGEGSVVDRRCLRTADNYPHRVARALDLALVDVTCSGSTAAELVTGPARGRAHRRPQVEAVDEHTRLVTITSGGNDIDFIGRVIAQACANLRAAGRSSCGSGRVPPAPPSPSDYARLETSLVAAVDAVKTRAPQATVILVDYTPIVSLDVPPCRLLPLTQWEVVQQVRIFDEMSAINQRVAEQTGARHLTTRPLMDRHAVCGAQPWTRGFGTTTVFHPNAAGKAGIADLIVGTIRS